MDGSLLHSRDSSAIDDDMPARAPRSSAP